MKLQKHIAYKMDPNRVQYKYVITIPEQAISELGWREGVELEALVKDKFLVVGVSADQSKKNRRIINTKMTYDQFRDKVKKTLQYKDRGMTWTHVREHLKLDQVVPNNKWVRRLEKDIGLMRVKGSDGVILWRVNHVK